MKARRIESGRFAFPVNAAGCIAIGNEKYGDRMESHYHARLNISR